MPVKVNAVLIPGFNDAHLKEVAAAVKEAGAFIMNVMPLVPQAEFSRLQAPGGKMLYRVRQELAQIIRQTDCRELCADDMEEKFC